MRHCSLTHKPDTNHLNQIWLHAVTASHCARQCQSFLILTQKPWKAHRQTSLSFHFPPYDLLPGLYLQPGFTIDFRKFYRHKDQINDDCHGFWFLLNQQLAITHTFDALQCAMPCLPSFFLAFYFLYQLWACGLSCAQLDGLEECWSPPEKIGLPIAVISRVKLEQELLQRTFHL